MSIFDKFKDRESKKTFEDMNSEAIKMFDAQKNAIKEIKGTVGYKELKKYLGRLKDAATTRVMTASVNDEKAKAMYVMVDEFLKFLESRE